MDEYLKQAEEFLNKAGATLEIKFKEHAPYFDEKTPRDIYECILIRGLRSYIFTFGQSLSNSMKYMDTHTKEIFLCNGRSENFKKTVTYKYLKRNCNPIKISIRKAGKRSTVIKRTPPNAYDILACLEKYDPGTFEEFCSSYGYDTDSRKAEKTYRAVKDQYQNLCMLFTEAEIKEMLEIQ